MFFCLIEKSIAAYSSLLTARVLRNQRTSLIRYESKPKLNNFRWYPDILLGVKNMNAVGC